MKGTSTWDRDTAPEKKQNKEIQREIRAGWTAFAKHRDIFEGNIGTCLQLMRTSSNGIWRGNMDTHQPGKEQASSRAKMETNVTHLDRKTNIWAREKTNITDVIEQVKRRKWTWAEHISRIRNDR